MWLHNKCLILIFLNIYIFNVRCSIFKTTCDFKQEISHQVSAHTTEVQPCSSFCSHFRLYWTSILNALNCCRWTLYSVCCFIIMINIFYLTFHKYKVVFNISNVFLYVIGWIILCIILLLYSTFNFIQILNIFAKTSEGVFYKCQAYILQIYYGKVTIQFYCL